MAELFVSYRIVDSAAHAGRLADALRVYWGRHAVFLAADDISQGARWRDDIMAQLQASRAVIAVVGPIWSTIADRDGVRRLTKGDDIVRMEIREALALGRPVIPVLVGGAALPLISELPPDISSLLNRNRAELRDDHWESDIDQLVNGLRKVAPALRIRDFHRFLASQRGVVVLIAGLLAAIGTGHVLLVRLDFLDAYTLRTLPYLLALVFAFVLLAHFVAWRRTR